MVRPHNGVNDRLGVSVEVKSTEFPVPGDADLNVGNPGPLHPVKANAAARNVIGVHRCSGVFRDDTLVFQGGTTRELVAL